MNINYLLLDEAVEWAALAAFVPLVSPQRQQRLAAFLRDDDRAACLLAELLVRRAAMEALDIGAGSIEFHTNPYGKPHLVGFPDFHFSISHTGGCVAVATGDHLVGLDVERHAVPNLAVAQRYFTPGEVEYIEQSGAPTLAFYEIWTKKEAYLKMLGTGLTRPLDSFDVISDGLPFFTRQLPGHTMTLCVDHGADCNSVDIRQITLSQLLDTFCP